MRVYRLGAGLKPLFQNTQMGRVAIDLPKGVDP